MESFRDSLIAKIDTIVADLHSNGNGHPQIQIEATILGDEPRQEDNKVVLGKFDIRQWQSPSPSPTSPLGRLRTRQRNSESLNQQLPSPQEETSDHTRAAFTSPEKANNEHEQPRRKAVGGLRLGMNNNNDITPPRTPSPPGVRQLETDQRIFPKRRRIEEGPKLQPSTVDKIIEGVW